MAVRRRSRRKVIKINRGAHYRWGVTNRDNHKRPILKNDLDKMNRLESVESLAEKSQLTQKDVDKFNKKIKSLAGKKFRA